MTQNYHNNNRNYSNQHRHVTVNNNNNNNDSLTITRKFNNYNNNNNNKNYSNNNYNNNNGNNRNKNWEGKSNYNNPGEKKTIPGNMKERKEIPMAQQVKLALQILTKLGDVSQFLTSTSSSSVASASSTGALEQDVIEGNVLDNIIISEELLSNIKTTAEIFITVGDLEEYPDEIASLFVQCFSQLSIQIPIFAALISLLHIEKPEFTQLVISKVQSRLIQAINEDDEMVVKLLLKSIACLSASQCFEITGTGGLVEILEALINVIKFDDDKGNSSSSSFTVFTRTNQVVTYLLASTLIWAAPILYERQQLAILSEAQQLLEKVKTSWRSPYAKENIQAIFVNAVSYPTNQDDEDDDEGGEKRMNRSISIGPYQQQDQEQDSGMDQSCWDTLWETCNTAIIVIASITGSGFQYPHCMTAVWLGLDLANSYHSSSSPLLAFDANFASTFITLHSNPSSYHNGTSLCLGKSATLCIPSKTSSYVLGSYSSSTWLWARFTIFDSESSSDAALCCKGMTILEKYQAYNYFQDVLHFFDPVINEDGTKLGSMELLTTHLLDIFKLFPKDIHLEYVLVEMLLQIIVQQPVNSALNASIYRLILELCRRSPQIFPPVVALGANIIFQIIPDMDYSAIAEYAKWFSFHLINTKLSWPYWDFWVSEYEEIVLGGNGDDNVDGNEASQYSTLQMFIRAIAEKCQAAVVTEKVKSAFPELFHIYIPNDQLKGSYCSLLTAQQTQASSNNDMNMEAECEEILVKQTSSSIFPQLTILLNEEKCSIQDVAMKLAELIDSKTSSDDVITWLEQLSIVGSDNNSTTDSESSSFFGWRGCLLTQVLVYKGTATGKQLSALIGYLDRYSEAIRNFAVLEQHQLDILAIYQEVFRGNSYMFQYSLNEIMRRGQVGVVAVARMLCGDIPTTATTVSYYNTSHFDISLNQLNKDPVVFHCIEILVDRTLDFVNAAIAQRKLLGGDMILDETLDLTPSSDHIEQQPAVVVRMTTAVAKERNDMTNHDNIDEMNHNNTNTSSHNNNNEDEDDYQSRRKRVRRDNDDVDDNEQEKDVTVEEDKEDVPIEGKDVTSLEMVAIPTDNIENDDDDDEYEVDHIWAAEEAVKNAIRNSRTVYTMVIKSLVHGILQTTPTTTNSTEGINSWMAVACSLLRRTIRVYHGLQLHLTQQYQQRIVITESQATLYEYLQQLPSSIPTATWLEHCSEN